MARLIPAQPDIDMPGHPAMATMDLDPVVAPVREPIGTLIAAMPTPARKRKKGTGEDNEPPGPSEPRRLRRSHEACARCRSKKIKASLSGDTDAHRQMPDILTLPPSATPNTQSAPLAVLLVSSAIRKTDIGRH